MNRYLLFDSGCSACSELVQEVVRASGGWMEAKSLRDPEIQSMLDRAHPNWRWEPMLLEIENDKLRVLTGVKMQAQIFIGLGPERTFQFFPVLTRLQKPSSAPGAGRREFLRRFGATLSGLVVFGFTRRFPFGDTTHTDRPYSAAFEGELYNGFVLLDDNAPIPNFVEPSRLGIPIACRVGTGDSKYPQEAVSKSFGQSNSLRAAAKFPIYTITNLPNKLRPGGNYLIEHASGEVYSAVTTFETPEQEGEEWEGCMEITAQPDFMRPYPLWSSKPAEPNGPSVVLEKADFLPAPGIMIETQGGCIFYWIKDEIFYTLRAEYGLSRQAAESLAKSLTLVN